jgi:hypothetical protein
MTPRLQVVVPVAREGIASPLPRIVAIVRVLEPLATFCAAS